MPELMQEGVELMILGMTVVFTLLGVMVVALKAMSGLAARLEPSPPDSPASGGRPVVGVTNSELIAVVTAAIQADRQATR